MVDFDCCGGRGSGEERSSIKREPSGFAHESVHDVRDREA